MQEAVRQLAMFLRGIPDADLGLVRETWPDCPESRQEIPAWLKGHPELARAVLAINGASPILPPEAERGQTYSLSRQGRG